jgi:UDP-glucuronate 4-epimerase
LKYLVTGAAGFIGYHTAYKLCKLGHEVVGIDNLNNYYDIELKHSRLKNLSNLNNFLFRKIDLIDSDTIKDLFQSNKFDRVIHLAAQPGVRYSIDNPMIYAESNLIGHLNILEACRNYPVEHFIYASSSSVYGMKDNKKLSTLDNVDHPISLYAATKKSNELMSHVYAHLYDIPSTGLRFFTVYGPWGRPDMALFKFTKLILNGDPIKLNNHGEMARDFTYIDDIVEGIIRIQDKIPQAKMVGEDDPSRSTLAPYRIFNIGKGEPQNLKDFVTILENYLGVKANIEYRGLQPGDVITTHADTTKLFEYIGYSPKVSIEDGIAQFVDWYREYYS